MVGAGKWTDVVAIASMILAIAVATQFSRPNNEHVSDAVGAFLKYHAEDEYLSKQHAEIGDDPLQFCLFSDYDLDFQKLGQALSESHAMVFDGELCDREFEEQDGNGWSSTYTRTGEHAWEIDISGLNCTSVRSCELMTGDCAGEKTYTLKKRENAWQVTDVSQIVMRCFH